MRCLALAVTTATIGLLVAACGSSGSSDGGSTTTPTVTVPSGKLSNAGTCIVPLEFRSGRRINLNGIRPVGVDCPAAVALASIYASSERLPERYTCSVKQSSSGGHAMCLNDARAGAYFSWTGGPASG